MTNKDKTGTARQQARRQREKEWLTAHGFTSWEALHTALMNGSTVVTGTIKPLTAAMDNVLAYRLGLTVLEVNNYPRHKIGDEIDRGLVLRRVLEEKGFYLTKKGKQS